MWPVVWVFVFLIFTPAYSQNTDIKLLETINHIDAGTGFNNSMLFITNSASAVEIGGVIGMGFFGWLKDDDKLLETAATTGVTLATNLLFTTAVKYAVNRPRPMVTYPDRIIDHGIRLTERSFPSGHTSSAFALATSLTLSYPKWYVAVPAYTWASAVAFSRMYLGVHYPSDVLGGIVVGAGSAYLTYKAKKWWDESRSRKVESKVTFVYAGFSERAYR